MGYINRPRREEALEVRLAISLGPLGKNCTAGRDGSTLSGKMHTVILCTLGVYCSQLFLEPNMQLYDMQWDVAELKAVSSVELAAFTRYLNSWRATVQNNIQEHVRQSVAKPVLMKLGSMKNLVVYAKRDGINADECFETARETAADYVGEVFDSMNLCAENYHITWINTEFEINNVLSGIRYTEFRADDIFLTCQTNKDLVPCLTTQITSVNTTLSEVLSDGINLQLTADQKLEDSYKSYKSCMLTEENRLDTLLTGLKENVIRCINDSKTAPIA